MIKKYLHRFIFALLVSFLLVFLGQGCSQDTALSLWGNSTNSGKAAEVGGNGGGYEGKLLFVHLEPNFSCEGKKAPTSILRRDLDKKWYFTKNTYSKCAEVSNQLVSDVVYNPIESILNYNQIEFVQLITTPWDNISLADALLQFPISPSSLMPMVCPINYIPVPARAPYTVNSFCVSQFEMKIKGLYDGIQPYDPAFVPESRPDGIPWGSIMRNDAIAECQSLGAGYDLISNDQWQTLAQNTELQSSNWTSSIIGVEGMYRGNSDASAPAPLSVNNLNDYYDQTGNDATQIAGAGKEQRRTLFLSNGEIIWDLAGNSAEWVKDDHNFIYGADTFISLITDTLYPAINPENGRTVKVQFGPSGMYSHLNINEYGGLGYAWINSGGNQVIRGQDHDDLTSTGVFTVRLGVIATDKSYDLGFRCVYSQ